MATGGAAFPPLDPTVLDELRAQLGDASVARILIAYLESLSQHLAELRAGLDRKDDAIVERAAHSLKGATRMIGGDAFAELCRGVEDLAREGNLDAVPHRVADIEAGAPEIEAAVRRQICT